MNVRLRMYQVLLFKFRRHYAKGQKATLDISVFKHGSEAFGSKLQIFQVSFVPQFPKETWIQRKQHQI